MLNDYTLEAISDAEIITDPFPHIVIDNFFNTEFADAVESQFPDFDSDLLWRYDNPVEKKRTCNCWDRYPKETYMAFWGLCSPYFTRLLSEKFGVELFADYGLNGGGWHMHGRGGKLNMHLDYSIHPKVPFERKFNIIIYMSKNWNPEWGGGLEMWSHDKETNKPKECIKKYDLVYNRAVVFDTTQHSWHGLPEPLNCPEGQYRKSLAVYYLQRPNKTTVEDRFRALFAPSKDQENDPEIERFIEDRAHIQR